MSSKTTMETLKGGMLLMILLLTLLLVAGGFIQWRYGARDRGPELKVTVNVPPEIRTSPSTDDSNAGGDWTDGLFPVPHGTIQTEPAIDATVPGSRPADIGIETAIREMPPRRIFCRTVARESDVTSAVRICSLLFEDDLDALVVFGRMSPGPSSLRMTGLTSGSVDTDGFHLVKGNRYFRIRRTSQTDDARAVAMAAVTMVATAAPAAPERPFERLLPAGGRVEGSWKIRSGADIGLPFLGNVLTCDYLGPKFEMNLFLKKAGTTEAAGKLLKQTIETTLANGGVQQRGAATDAGIKVFQVGSTLELFGMAGATVFGIRRASSISRAVELAEEIISMRDVASTF